MYLLPSGNSKYKDIPFVPKSYKIVRSRDAVPGTFTSLGVKVGKKRFKLKAGTLDIKKFDLTGVAGSFAIKAESKGETIDVSGAFDYPCTDSGHRRKK